MKNILYVIIVFFAFFAETISQNQNYFYYYKGKKINIVLDKTRSTVISEKENASSTMRKSNDYIFEDEIKNCLTIVFPKELSSEQYSEKLKYLNKEKDVVKANPNFLTITGKRIGLSDYFYVKLHRNEDYNLLVEEAKKKNTIVVEQNKFMPLWYTLKITKKSEGNTLEIANQFYETKLFASSQPDFLSDDRFCSTDPMFNNLWGLKNTSHPNIDINICKAWQISQGENIKVAVLDQGIFKEHIDLASNIYNLSFNTETNLSPSLLFGDHGTHCAGTIAAVRNNTQVVGVAPLSKLMDVSNSLKGTPNSRIKRADGINWAWQNGADIISNSWGSVRYEVIDDAISNALTKGRNGKGCIIVFASGNDYGQVSYPANSNPNILSVGAISSDGRRASFSNYGRELDVVAPGVGILSTVPNNSVSSEDGTSMACPHVAGVAALILSVNPDLTAKQVADIIEQTAQKVGGYNYQNTYTRPNGTWNNEMGYGLVDAYKALQKATIAGPDEFCLRTDATFELIAPIPNDATIKWEDPEYRLEIVSGQGTKSCVFRGTYWDGNRTIKAVVTYKDGTVKSFEKEVYVRYQGNWANAQYTIKNHPQSPYSTPCCNGSTRVIKHVILDDYMGGASTKVEWKNTIVYKDPKDKFEFRGTNREEEFVATRYTFTPFIVETKMRYISDCGTPTKWSNTIARYYGAINETSFRSASAYNSPTKSTNEDIPVYEFFTNRASTLRVQTEDLQQWLDAKYSGKELNDKELQKVLYYLNNRDNLDKIGVKVFDFSGKRILQGDLDFGKSLDFNMSRYAKGFYIITYEFGSISNGKVIYKP